MGSANMEEGTRSRRASFSEGRFSLTICVSVASKTLRATNP
jgi:hypothetical protein